MEIELRHLRSFIAIAEERHFGRAAERLGMAQPALSQQIRRFEEELGAELIDRANRPIGLTAVGEALLEEAYLTLEQSERALERTRQAAREAAARLSIGAIAWTHHGILPELVRAFRAQLPDTSFDIKSVVPSEQAHALRSERIDVGFANWLIDTRAINTEALLAEPIVAVVPYDHPLADRAVLSLSEIAREPFVSASRRGMPNLFEDQSALFRRRRLRPRVAAVAETSLDQVGLVAAGLGVGLTLASLSTLRPPGVAFVPLQEESATTTVFMLWRRDDDREIVQAFLESARQVAQTFEPWPSSSAELEV